VEREAAPSAALTLESLKTRGRLAIRMTNDVVDGAKLVR